MGVEALTAAQAKILYLDYYCNNNKLGTSSSDIGQIKEMYKDKLESWQKSASTNDENEYKFDDDEFNTSKLRGKQAAAEATGHNGKTGKNIARGAADAVWAAGGIVASELTKKAVTKATEEALKKGTETALTKAATNAAKGAAKKAAEKAAKEGAEKTLGVFVDKATRTAAKEAGTKAAEKVTKESLTKTVEKVSEETGEKVAETALTKTGEEATKATGESIGCIIGCTMALATGIAYVAKQPNKQEKEACDQLQGQMLGAQEVLGETQNEMAYMQDELANLTDEANQANEDANSQIEEKKTEYDAYKATYEALKAKVDSGKGLTPAEKDLYKEIVTLMTEAGIEIEETQEGTTDNVQSIYSDMETYQEGYDYAAETLGEVQGLTDYAAGMDTTTQVMCYVEAGAQTINVAGAAKSAYEAAALASSGSWAFGATAWAWAFVAMGVAGGAMSAVGAGQQLKWAGDVGTEVQMRKATQTLNTETTEIYTAELDIYDGLMGDVEDLEVNMPNDIAAPENAELPSSENTELAMANDLIQNARKNAKSTSTEATLPTATGLEEVEIEYKDDELA